MTENTSGYSPFTTAGFIFSSFTVLSLLFLERWKQFVMVSMIYFIVTEKRYRFIYLALKTFPRDAKLLIRYVYTLLQFFYWKFRGGGIARIFLSNVQRHPNKIAFRYQEESWTFQQVENYSNQVANFFKSQGVARGDHMALLMENHPQVVMLWLGLSKLGAVTALINNNQRSTILSHSIRSGQCSGIICGSELVDALREILPEWPQLRVYVVGHTPREPLPASVDLDVALRDSPSTPVPLQCDMNDSFLFIYTSGTTGLPKAAKMNHVRFFMMARGANNMLWLRNDDVVYDSLPLYHTAGGLVGAGQAILNGLTVVIRSKFSVSNFWADCIKYNCTVAQYIGEMCRFLLMAPEKPEERAHNVRIMMGNGMRPQIWQQFLDRFHIQHIGEFYGATESNCNMINTENVVGAVGFLPWFASLLNPYYLIKADQVTNEPIRDERGLCIICKDGEPGILVGKVKKVHPFSQFTGYADKEATQKKILRNVVTEGDEYFNSGDILVKDEFGNFYFKDRTGDTFRWRGENVATSEVEAVISNVVKLKDAIVYGVEIPHVEGRAGMAAIVDTDDTLKLEELADGMRNSLPAYARPLFLRVLRTVPITGTFKLKKTDLQNDGYNPSVVKDPLYFFKGNSFIPLSKDLYDQIVTGKVKL